MSHQKVLRNISYTPQRCIQFKRLCVYRAMRPCDPGDIILFNTYIYNILYTSTVYYYILIMFVSRDADKKSLRDR